MIIVPFLPMHLEGFEPQEMQKEVLGFMSKTNYGEFLFNSGEAYTVLDGDVVACGGICPVSETRGVAWAVLSKNTKAKHMIYLTKQVIKKFNQSSFERIEAIISYDFINGNRWAKIMGMKNETPEGMMSFYEKNDKFNLYSKVKS